MNRVYICIDLKSFYASVECVERGLDPMTTNLVVADKSRTEKTICLAVSPSLKKCGLPGRCRLFEVVQKVKQINTERAKKVKQFTKKSYDSKQLEDNNNLELDYIVASPRMKLYIDYSTKIYNIYLKYLSCEDIHVYSIDEVFCDVTNYLKYYKLTAEELVIKILHDIYRTTGITATAGIGTNLYLAKVAMDIVSKHKEADKFFNVRIATLDEKKYRKLLWNYRPITDFWRVGRGYAKKLEDNNIYTMGDIARVSINNEDILYKLFGVNAELLIDHAWGVEPCTIEDIKKYKPVNNCLSSGQVLSCAYSFSKAKIVVREMIELLVLDLVSKNLVTDQIVLTIGYDIQNINSDYKGDIKIDYYGRKVPKSAHGSINLKYKTSSTQLITEKCMELYEEIVSKKLLIKRINITVNNLVNEEEYKKKKTYEQINLFEENTTNYLEDSKEKSIQKTILDIKSRYGKNAILKGMDFVDGATTIERNKQIGGHKA